MSEKLLILLCLITCIVGCSKSDVGSVAVSAQAAIDDKVIQTYLSSNNLTGIAKKIDTSGVYYVIISPGSGNAIFTNSTLVTVGDTGKLLTTQQVFTETDNFHPSFVLGQVISGWQLGIPQIKQGGTVRLFIPSRYAYGPYAQPLIGLPANAVLDFDITLYGITN